MLVRADEKHRNKCYSDERCTTDPDPGWEFFNCVAVQ